MKLTNKYLIAGAIFVLIAGTVSHFVYDWSNQNMLVGFFFPVNESTWEHMKLVFFPMLLFSLYTNRKFSPANVCVATALLLGTLSGTWLIPIIFYTYTGILGYNTTVLNLLTFAFSVIGGFLMISRQPATCGFEKWLPLLKIFTFLMAIAFFFFTYFPPSIGLFVSPE